MPFDPSKIRARLATEEKWYSVTNLVGGEADVMLYGEIGWLGTTAEDFVRDIKQLQASQINLYLSSPGGGVFDGIAIMNALRAHPANVTVYVDALAASIASVIAMAGDRIVARQASEFMIHEASGLVIGSAADCREMAELLDRQSDKIAAIYAERAGGTVEEWREAMAKETWYSAEEAVAVGLADEVETIPRKSGVMPGPGEEEMPVAAKWDLSVFRYAGREKAPAPSVAAKATPKPAPPAATPEAQPTLTIPIGAALGEQIADALRAAVTPEPAAAPAPEPAPIVAEPVAPLPAAEAVDPERAPETAPAEPQPLVIQVQINEHELSELWVDTGRKAVAARTEPAAPAEPEPAPAPPGLAALAAHLTKPARPEAPTWRDRVAHLNPPSSATTRTA